MTDEKINEFQKQLGISILPISAITKMGIEQLKILITKMAVYDESQLDIVGDIIKPGDTVILITHIDCAAPKGRIILPQQQTIRNIIENSGIAVVTQETNLQYVLNNLKEKPALVITDSLVSGLVASIVPLDLKLTSFSILLARQKGSLEEYCKGLTKVKNLKAGSKILVVETCTHHRQKNDLGKAQIPNYLKQLTGNEMLYEWASGTVFPEDINKYDGIIHCGACMINRKEMQHRINVAKYYNIPITNYGILIACAQGILKRVLEPFSTVYESYIQSNENG